MTSSPMTDSPGVQAVKVQVTDIRITVDLEDGRTLIVPTDWLPRLKHATEAERNNVEIGPWGIEWPDVEADASIRGLLAGQRSHENPACFNYWLENRQQGKRVTVMDWLALRRQEKVRKQEQ